ncbi:MAG: hypothetical protein JW940_15005 [Polyangiaceae bacterium]|nr:hypothetical protein [Polyangiaceae bacterium]
MRCWPALLALAIVFGCSKAPDVVAYTPAEKKAEPAVDADPLALLPSGMIGLVALDMKPLLGASFGSEIAALSERFAPLPKSAEFDSKHDVDRVIVASYSLQGVDYVGVVRGRFKPAAIENAAKSGEPSPLGAPMTQSTYAGRSVIAVQDVAMTVLSEQTVIFGNPTALQRALDRIEEGRVERKLPTWLDKLVATPNAPIVAGWDLAGQPAPDALRRQLGFLEGLETARVVGNYESPGVNLAGTLSYGDAVAATRGAESLNRMQDLMARYEWVFKALGVGQPLERLQAEPRDKEATFVVAINGNSLKQILVRLPTLNPSAFAPGTSDSPANSAPTTGGPATTAPAQP